MTFEEKKKHKTACLTPSKCTEFEDVRRHIWSKDLDQGQIHVDCTQSHPSKGSQEKVMLKGCYSNTDGIAVKRGKPGVHQEEHVQP